MSDEPAPPRRRDREATQARLLEAAYALLAREGFAGLGLNAVAAEAGVDKKLIYRYFGGLDGLLEHLGARLDIWLKIDPDAGIPDSADYADTVGALLVRYEQALRADPAVQGVLAWELAAPSELTLQMDAARSAAMRARFAQVLARTNTARKPMDIDAPAVNALLIAGLHHLVLRERAVGSFGGLDLKDPQSWLRLEKTLVQLVERIYRADVS